jgi:iron complex outermembrane receptor protein
VVFSFPTVFIPKAPANPERPLSGRLVKRGWIVFVSLLLASVTFGQQAEQIDQSDAIQFQISQLDAGTALNEFAKQASVQMLFDYEIVQDVRTNEVRGEYQVWHALELLVADTGLEAIRVDNGRYSVVSVINHNGETDNVNTRRNIFAAALAAVFSTGAVVDVVAQDTNNSRVLEEIVVTAQKRAQSLQDVPVTVNALSEENLTEFGVDSLFEVANLVPGMVFSRAPDDGLALTLRGLGTPARTQSFDQSVALFLDGTFMGKGRMYSAAFFDVERMEVIKGTQSTLLGKNTSLGAISIVTRKPGDVVGGNLRASAEMENGGWGLDAGIDIPVSDNFAVRAAIHATDQEGWVKNIVTGQNVPDDEETGLRLTGVYTPSDDLTATAIFQHSESIRSGNGFQFVDQGGYLPPPVVGAIGEVDFNDTKSALCIECPDGESNHDTTVDSFSINIDYQFDNLTLTSVTSLADYQIKFFDDFDFGNALDEVNWAILNPGDVSYYSTYFERDEDYSQFSQELRIASPAEDDIAYMAGLFYFTSEWDSSEAQNFSTPNFPPPAIGDFSQQAFNGGFTNNFTQDTETISLFGQVTLNHSDRLRTSLGLRYTDEQKDAVFERVQSTPATLWNTILNPPFAPTPLSFDDSFVNGNLNIQYDATDSAMVYASYGVGSKTGGFAESAEVQSADPSLGVDAGGSRVKTEEARTFELGAKMSLAGGAANLNIALFQTEITDFQETSFQVLGPTTAFFLTRNIDAESKGVEVDGQWQATDALRLVGGITYADAINADDGTDLAQAPKVTSSVGFVLETQIGSDLLLTTNGYSRYRDDMVSQINETFPSESMTSFDLSMSLSSYNANWQLSLIGTNITNELSADFNGPPAAPIGAIFGAPAGDQGITIESPSPLRSVSLQYSYNF